MSDALHDDALRLLGRWRAPTPAQEQLRCEYVAHLQAHPDGTRRSCLPDHLTASVLVLDPPGRHVLLTLHAKAGKWFQLGGHLEPGDATVAAAALREATEESGLNGLTLDPDPVQLDSHQVAFCGGRPDTRHLDVRFLAVAPTNASGAGSPPSVVSEESLDVAWWPVEDLPSPEESLHELVAYARDRLAGR